MASALALAYSGGGDGAPLKLKAFYLLYVGWNREIDFIASILAFCKFVAWKCSENVYGNSSLPTSLQHCMIPLRTIVV